MSGKATFFGTLKHLDSERVVSFQTETVLGMGSGMAFGVAAGWYNVTGTLTGFDVLTRTDNFSIAFGTLGWKAAQFGGGSISDRKGSWGEVDIGGTFAPPIGAAIIGFDKPSIRVSNAGKCR